MSCNKPNNPNGNVVRTREDEIQKIITVDDWCWKSVSSSEDSSKPLIAPPDVETDRTWHVGRYFLIK